MSQTVLKAESLVAFLNNKFKTDIEVKKDSLIERKEFIFNSIDTIDEVEGSVYCTISTEDVDRGGDMMIAAGMDINDFKKIPSVYVSHDYSLLPIAKCTEIHHLDKSIVAKIVFCREVPAIKNIWELVKSGTLKGVSIGFEALKVLQKGSKEFNSYIKECGIMASEDLKRIIPAWKMYEFSVVSIPMNQNCYIKSLNDSNMEVSEDLGKFLGFDKIPKAVEVVEEVKDDELPCSGKITNCKECNDIDCKTVVVPEEIKLCKCDKCDKADCKCSGKECKTDGCTCECHKPVAIVAEEPKRFIHIEPKRHLITVRTPEDVKEFVDLAVKTRISGRKNII